MCIFTFGFYCITLLKRLFVEIFKDLNIFQETEVANYNSRCSRSQYPVVLKDKVMARTSSIEMQQSVTENKMEEYDVLPKDTVNLSSSYQQLQQQINDLSSFIDVESSKRNSENIQKSDYKAEGSLAKPTLVDTDKEDSLNSPTKYFSVNTAIDNIPFVCTGDFSMKSDVYKDNPINPSIRKSEVQFFSEDNKSNILSSSIFEKTERDESFPLGWAESPRDAESSPIVSEKLTFPSVRRNDDNPFSNETVLSRTFNALDFNEVEPTGLMPSPARCMQFKDEEKDPVYSENSIISSARGNNDHPISEETASSYVFNSSVLKETELTGLFRSPFMYIKSKDKVNDASGSSSDHGGVKNISNENGIFHTTEFPFKPAPSKTDDPIIATENTNDTSFPPSLLVNAERFHGDHIADTSDTKSKNYISFLDTPLFSSLKTNLEELSKPSQSKVKKPFFIDKNYNKSSTEFMLNLINWKKMGLDKAFNLSVEDNTADFGNDLQCGLDLMKELINHVRILLSATKTLPDLNLEICDRVDILHTGMTVWLTINELEIFVIQTINDMTTNPDIVINLFNKMTYKLSVLCEKMEDFRNTIRLYCSELEKLL